MKRLDVVLLAMLFAFALILRVGIVALYHFDGLYGQDPFAYYDFSAAMAGGQTPGIFFWPLGYPALLTVGFWFFGVSATVGQAISIFLGALLSPFVYILTRQMDGGRLGGFIAGVLMAICGQAVQSSIVIMADIPALAWVTVSALCLWQYVTLSSVGVLHAKPLRIWLVLSAVTLAIACITRWLCLIFIPLWGLIYLISVTRQSKGLNPLVRSLLMRREVWLSVFAVLIIFIPQIFYSRSNPYPTLNHAWVEGWSPDNAQRSEFVNADGQFMYEKINALYYAQVYYEPYYLAPVWTPFILLGILALLWKREFRKVIFLVGWALLPYLFLIGIPYQNIRFPLIVFPSVAALVGIGVSQGIPLVIRFVRWLGKRLSMIVRRGAHRSLAAQRSSSRFQKVQRFAAFSMKTFALVLLMGAGSWQTYTVTNSFLSDFLKHQLQDRATAEWAAAQIPEGARVYCFGLTLTLEHYTTLEVIDLYHETPTTLDDGWVRGEADYLLVNVWSMNNQWIGREPQLAVQWLMDERGLVRIERYEYYTLYRVNG
jgi:4-amino-4-deoxy-L-arabinose transferase-like glycosyltransferase